MAKKLKLKTTQVVELLEKKYPAPEWAFFEQVGNATGFSCNGWADAMALGLWPSRGYAVHGFEVKVSRSDVVKELKNPEKADLIAKYCDYWWLVIGDTSIIKESELPKNWGLMVPNNSKSLKIKIDASQLKPKRLDVSFIAAVLRGAHKAKEKNIDRIVKEAVSNKIKESSIYRSLEYKHKELLDKIEKFNEHSGININSDESWAWNLSKVGEIVKLISNIDHYTGPFRSIENAHDNLAKAIEWMSKAREEIGLKNG